MEKRSKIILVIFGVVVLAIVTTEIIRPKPINWRPSYTASDKVPFGCYVLYNELADLFPESEIKTIEESLYDVLVHRDTLDSFNYLMINDHIAMDEQETRQLLQFVADGNSAFLAATSVSYILADTLNLGFQSNYALQEDTVAVSLTHNRFRGSEYLYSRGLYSTHITRLDSSTTTILGYLKFERKNDLTQKVEETVKMPNFIMTQHGKGRFFIHTTPQAFTNYYLLNGNEEYVSRVFSYLNHTALYWDNYKKASRVIIDSPMRFVLNQTALRWTYYLTIAGLLLFVIFKGKREQRIIPVIPPNENSSVEFARTVGSLYYQNKNYTDLIQKKIRFLFAYIHERYYVDISEINQNTAELLAAKSGKAVTEIKILMDLILELKGKPVATEQDLIHLNNKIYAFTH